MTVRKFRIIKNKKTKKFTIEESSFFGILWTTYQTNLPDYESAVKALENLKQPYLLQD